MFITFEGVEGCGKSTQARLLADFLSNRLGADRVVLTREPGGTKIGEHIREVVHSHRHQEMHPLTEFLLYNAARAQIVNQVIRPALAADKLVLCDRFADSTIAYQGYGRQLDLEMVQRVIGYATGGLKPDLTFFLDLPVEVGLARRTNGHHNGEELNRMDTQTRDFYHRVREGYEILMQQEPQRWVRLDGTGTIADIQAELQQQMLQHLAWHESPTHSSTPPEATA